MKLEDIDHLFAIMAAEAADKGDETLLPGAVMLSSDSFCRIPHGSSMTCSRILDGIRYRGVRVNVSGDYQDQVLNRAEAGARGEPYVDNQGRVMLNLEPQA